MDLQEIEAVARALYEIQEEARGWDREPEPLKARFRKEARAALAVLDKHGGSMRRSTSAQLQDLVVISKEADEDQ